MVLPEEPKLTDGFVGDDEPLDLRRSVANLRRLRVSEEPLERKISADVAFLRHSCGDVSDSAVSKPID